MKRCLGVLGRFAAVLSVVLAAVVVAIAPARAETPGAQGQGKLSAPQIEQLVAPIALYPDNLLSQVLMASTYPLEVIEAARWTQANPNVKGPALEAAMQKQSWDASVKALTAVPQTLTMLSDKLDWTQQLGDAFLAQQRSHQQTVRRHQQTVHRPAVHRRSVQRGAPVYRALAQHTRPAGGFHRAGGMRGRRR